MNTPDRLARPALPLIVFGVLKGYIQRPLLFMVGTLVTLPGALKALDSDLPADFIRSQGFIIHLYRRLQKREGKERAFEIVRAAVLCSGLALMQANFRNVEAPRRFENLVRYQKTAKEEGATRLNTMEIDRDEDGLYEYRVTSCLFFRFFAQMGCPELCSIMCAIDNAIFNSYLPNEIVFTRYPGETMPEGARDCRFRLTRRQAAAL